MTVVVDSNVVFSALLSKNNRFAKKFFNRKHVYTTANFLVYEIFNHKEKILDYCKLNDEELKEHFKLIFAHLRLIPSLIFLFEIIISLIK